MSQKWAIKNFCRIMDAMMNDFRSEKFNQLTSMNATALALYNSPDKSSPAGTGRSGDGSAGMEKDQQERAQGTTPSGGGGQGKRPFHLQFSDVEARFQNAFVSPILPSSSSLFYRKAKQCGSRTSSSSHLCGHSVLSLHSRSAKTLRSS